MLKKTTRQYGDPRGKDKAPAMECLPLMRVITLPADGTGRHVGPRLLLMGGSEADLDRSERATRKDRELVLHEVDTEGTRRMLRGLSPSLTERECREVISYITAMDVPGEDHYGECLAHRLERYRLLQILAGGHSVWDHLLIGLERWWPGTGADGSRMLRFACTVPFPLNDEALRGAVDRSNDDKLRSGAGYEPGSGAEGYLMRILGYVLNGPLTH